MFRTIEWLDEEQAVRLVDQTKLPLVTGHIITESHERIAHAIETMEIRGAPAIGAAAGMGMALAAIESNSKTKNELLDFLETAAVTLNTRPTAVNLTWATSRMLSVARNSKGGVDDIVRVRLRFDSYDISGVIYAVECLKEDGLVEVNVGEVYVYSLFAVSDVIT